KTRSSSPGRIARSSSLKIFGPIRKPFSQKNETSASVIRSGADAVVIDRSSWRPPESAAAASAGWHSALDGSLGEAARDESVQKDHRDDDRQDGEDPCRGRHPVVSAAEDLGLNLGQSHRDGLGFSVRQDQGKQE